MDFPQQLLDSKKARALDRLRACDGVVIALSGGVDSAVLLALALEALGRERVLAVTGVSPAVPDGEVEDARSVAAELGARHVVVETHEMQREAYRANAGDRCFHCRTELFEVLGRLAGSHGLEHVAYGAIKDDAADFRPGMRAADRLGALAPLLEADLDKADVRRLARQAGLSVREKPAAACLGSRIPIGVPVTPERLARVGRAEEALRRLGFRQFRVRHHGEVARLELDPDGDARLADPEVRAAVVSAVRQAGYRFVTLDLEGYRTGSLNPVRPSGG